MSLRSVFTAVARPAAASQKNRIVAGAARTSYRQYSGNAGSSNGSARTARAPIALSLLGLGSVGSYFGLTSEAKDPKTTQEGMRKEGSTVDYQQVSLPSICAPIRCSAAFHACISSY